MEVVVHFNIQHTEAIGSWDTLRVVGKSGDVQLQLQQRPDADVALASLVNTRGLLGLSTVPHLDAIDVDYADVSCKQFMKKKMVFFTESFCACIEMFGMFVTLMPYLETSVVRLVEVTHKL